MTAVGPSTGVEGQTQDKGSFPAADTQVFRSGGWEFRQRALQTCGGQWALQLEETDEWKACRSQQQMV